MFQKLFSDYETFLIFLVIIVGTIIVATIFSRLFGRIIKNSTLIMRNDPTNYHFFKHFMTAVIYSLGFGWALYILPIFTSIATSLLTGAGILALVAGMASQHALSNIISGVFIVISKPFGVKDQLIIGDYKGTVEDITLRHVVIRDFENRRIIIPNTIISDQIIINADYNDGRIIKWIEINISYKSDIDKAKAIIREEIAKHPLWIDGRDEEARENGDEAIPVRIISLDDSSIKVRGWAWASDQSNGFEMKCDLLESIKKRFDAEDIEIPYPYHNVVMSNAT